MESAVQTLDFQDDEVDIDSILKEFPFDLDSDLWQFDWPSDESTSDSMKEPEALVDLSLFADEVEKFLMEDAGGDEGRPEVRDKVVDEFVSGLLVDGSGSDSGRSEMASPESGDSSRSAAAAEETKDRDEEGVEDEEEEIRKKRRRQIRNRESAMQSRERKKMYVKELEMKSKYLESECRRLDYALRCCMAENLALHQHLQKDGARSARQESAVLFVGMTLKYVGFIFLLYLQFYSNYLEFEEIG